MASVLRRRRRRARRADRRRSSGGSPRRRRGRERGRDRAPSATRCTAGRSAPSSATRPRRTSSRPGVKYNVIPGVAEIEVDCRTLPGTDEPAMREPSCGAGWATSCGRSATSRRSTPCRPSRRRSTRTSTGLLESTIRDHDPDGVPVPVMVPFATDAKHTHPARASRPTASRRSGSSPTSGSSSGSTASTSGSALDALRFGLPVLYDVVRRFCG